MPLVEAWECPRTGTLFKHKHDYVVHLRDLAVLSIAHKKQEKYRKERAAFWKGFRESISDVDQLVDAIAANWEHFCRNAHDYEISRWGKDEEFDMDKWIVPYDVKIHLNFRINVSNSHNAPIGEKTNWGSKPGLPTSYPGFSGHIHWHHDGGISKKHDPLPGSFFNGTGICTGSGGGGRAGASQDIYLFLPDWPNLFHCLTFDQQVQTLSGNFIPHRTINVD
jgi:hypothetical protein